MMFEYRNVGIRNFKIDAFDPSTVLRLIDINLNTRISNYRVQNTYGPSTMSKRS